MQHCIACWTYHLNVYDIKVYELEVYESKEFQGIQAEGTHILITKHTYFNGEGMEKCSFGNMWGLQCVVENLAQKFGT